MTSGTLTPRLIVKNADGAIAFYKKALAAKLEERFADPGGHVVHALLSFHDVKVALTEEKPDWHNHAPTSLDGSPVLLNLVVDDVDVVAKEFETAGAAVVFPVADRVYGHREGRLRDPFGHLWIFTSITEKLSAEEIEARMSGKPLGC